MTGGMSSPNRSPRQPYSHTHALVEDQQTPTARNRAFRLPQGSAALAEKALVPVGPGGLRNGEKGACTAGFPSIFARDTAIVGILPPTAVTRSFHNAVRTGAYT